ncbi:hypothetical protein ACIB24_05890 [Spongisporangium articulatum]|uniref:GNAT family N-acetyltransferase n=1 Tax=Spongisporangium articulatum TaxID=3362603 RepID=A0ABW8AJP9_9ACTN
MTVRPLSGFGPDDRLAWTSPADAPLTYPGVRPIVSCVLHRRRLLAVHASPGRPVGHWRVGPESASATPVPLDDFLRQAGAAPTARRHPVLAIGSNASPAQLHRKLSRAGCSTTVPILRVEVQGLRVGVSAHISAAGYLPTSPVLEPAADERLHLLLLDADQLEAVDRTEPNYVRTFAPHTTVGAGLESGEVLGGVHVYAGRHGLLTDEEGLALRPADQHRLVSGLLARSVALRAVMGETPEAFVTTAQNRPDARARGTELFRTEGLVMTPRDLSR